MNYGPESRKMPQANVTNPFMAAIHRALLRER